MRIAKNNFDDSQLVILKDEDWLYKQKKAGRCVSHILKECGKLILNKTPNLNLKDLENLASKYMEIHDCTPTFWNYIVPNKPPFPGKICISINNQLVHGIPIDYILQDGDVVSVDLGATYQGAIADAARTWIYGTPKSIEHVRLLKAGWEALGAAKKAIEVGKHIGVIGYAIHQYVKNTGFGLITNYGGHGIDYNKAHSNPFISNKSQPNDGIRIQPGLSIAIEPMLVIGEARTKELDDGWTVVTPGIGCHFEDSVTVMEDGIHTITEVLYEEY